MKQFKLEKGTVFYEEHLDAGGTTFAVNCLKNPSVNQHIKRGKILEMCSGPGFMGFYLNFEGYADELYLSDINLENELYIKETINQNSLTNTKFINSNVFDSFNDDIIFDTILINPPHYSTPRPGGYKDEYEKLISLDLDMNIHKNFFTQVKKFMNDDSRIVLVENAGGISADDIINLTKNDFDIEIGEYNRYGWIRDSRFYTVILRLKRQ